MQDGRWRRASRAAGRVWLAAALALAGAASAASPPPPLRVLAAASLTEVVEALATRFADARIEPSFGASSDLARQIADGAPADVFLSASPEWIDFLQQAGAVAGEPVVFARNRLVCIATKGSPLAARGAAGPRALLAGLGPDDRVAIADEGVPAGTYAREALRAAGLLGAYLPKLVGQKDVRAVLRAVEQGDLPAGFVYATDARLAAVTTLFVFDPAAHSPIEYQAVAIKGAAHPAEAQRFLVFLRGDVAGKSLADAGLLRP